MTVNLLPGGKVRLLLAPCGCVAAADVTTNVPGFCRTTTEAEEDIAAGFHEATVSRDDYRARPLGCNHEPKWSAS